MANDPSSEVYTHTMFNCVPLRLAVLFCALFSFLTSLLYLCDRPLWLHILRPVTGGYAMASSVTVGVVEVTGAAFGLLGILGVWFTRRSYLTSFNLWQYARLAAWGYSYSVDIPLMFHCEDWVNSVEDMTREHGWNDVMYSIALEGRCPHERGNFFGFSFVALIVFMYMVYGTRRYLDFLDRLPRHLLRVPKDLSGGVFYAKPVDRAFLQAQGQYGTCGGAADLATPSFGGAPLPPSFGAGGMPLL